MMTASLNCILSEDGASGRIYQKINMKDNTKYFFYIPPLYEIYKESVLHLTAIMTLWAPKQLPT